MNSKSKGARLDALLRELCPGGVEYKKLGNVFDLFSGMTGVSNKWSDKGNCKFIDYLNVFNNLSVDVTALKNATVKSQKQNRVRRGDILLTEASETPEECATASVVEKDVLEDTFLDDHLFGLRIKHEYSTELFPSYFKYAFSSREFRKKIIKAVRGVTRFYISKDAFIKLTIPVPPMEIQEEIVRILDRWTELEAELEAELVARKAQYEYYRDFLLDFHRPFDRNTRLDALLRELCPGGVEYRALGELCSVVTKQTGFDYTNHIKNRLVSKQDVNTIPYIQTKFFSGHKFNYDTDYYVPNEVADRFPRIVLDQRCLLFSIVGASIGNVGLFPAEQKCFLGGAICVAKILAENNIDFLYYCVESKGFQRQIRKKIKGPQATITVDDIRKFKVPVPPMEIQEEIVRILDRFDTLAHSAAEGIPAETEARRRQYEYYRDRLLSFEKKQTNG